MHKITMQFLVFFLSFLFAIHAQPMDISEESSSGVIVTVKQTQKKESTQKICTSDSEFIRACVPYYLCLDGKINSNGSNVINPRSGGGQTCLEYYEECCIVGSQVSAVPKDEFKSEEKSREELQCGKRNLKKFTPKITKNSDGEAEFGEFPWMIAILKDEISEEGSRNVYLCGGSLITPQVVLTAAHCVYDKYPDLIKVRAGEWDTQTKHPTFPHVDVDVAEIVVHEQFNFATLHNGIALLMLSEPLKLRNHINLICLPPPNANFDGKRCVVAGWGKDAFGIDGNYQTIMKKLKLPTVPFDQCQRSLRKSRLGHWFVLHEGFMCAGGEVGRDACKGDGGSPLICPIDKKPGYYYQAGIVSWGIGCGEDGTPGVYIDVAKYRNWIENKIAEYF